MKTYILVLCLVLLQYCNNPKSTAAENKNIEVKPTIGSESLVTTYETSSQNKKSLSNDNIVRGSLKIAYEENLNIPKEFIDKMPAEIREQALEVINKPIKYTLDYNGYSSSYKIDDGFVKDRKVVKDSKNSNSFSLAEYSTYKNFNDNTLIIRTGVTGDIYLINTKIKKYNWNITNESKIIGNYKCKKATTKNEHGLVTAYFTDEVPANIGPSVYGDLPGLIVYLEAPDRIYKVSRINHLDKIEIEKFREGKNVTEEEYKKIVEKYQNHAVIEERVELQQDEN